LIFFIRVFLPENNPDKYQGPLPNDVDLMLQLSLGLEYIHSHNIAHRNISPSNILISFLTGTVLLKWSGFDLFKRTIKNGEFVMSGYKGTVVYWAPEISALHIHSCDVLQQVIITTKSDIFSFACVLFEFFTKGIHPFGSNQKEIITNIASCNLKILEKPTNLKGIHQKLQLAENCFFDCHILILYIELRESHFGYETIKKMLAMQPKERPNLREIIPILTSLKYKFDGNSEMEIDEDAAYQELNNV